MNMPVFYYPKRQRRPTNVQNQEHLAKTDYDDRKLIMCCNGQKQEGLKVALKDRIINSASNQSIHPSIHVSEDARLLNL